MPMGFVWRNKRCVMSYLIKTVIASEVKYSDDQYKSS